MRDHKDKSTRTVTNARKTLKTLAGGLLGTVLCASIAAAQSCDSYPYTLRNGNTADAAQVMADFNAIGTCAGTWTPSDGSGAGLSLSVTRATYKVVGNIVFVEAYIAYPTTSDSRQAIINGLPYVVPSGGDAPAVDFASDLTLQFSGGGSQLLVKRGFTYQTNANLSGAVIIFSGFYFR